MVRLRVIRGFHDLEAGIHRKPGEVFEVSETRARVILAAGVAEVVEKTDEATQVAGTETAEAPPATKRTRKRKG